jgi:hypothetical protein
MAVMFFEASKPKARVRRDYEHPLTIFAGIYPSIEEYQDATASPFTLSIGDAVAGVMKVVLLGWFDYRHFNSDVYNFYLAPENGFMTWVVLAAPAIADSPLLFDMLPLFRKVRIPTVVTFATEAREGQQRSGARPDAGLVLCGSATAQPRRNGLDRE